MSDSYGEANLSVLEAEVEAARARLADSLENLTRPSLSAAVKNDIKAYAETLKNEAVEKIGATRDHLMASAREASRKQVLGISNAVRAHTAANPLALVMLGAALGWKFYRRPPVATLLAGAGALSLLLKARRPGRWDSQYYDPYRRRQPASYVPGGVAGYGYPVEAEAPGQTVREKANEISEKVSQLASSARESASARADQIGDAASQFAATARREIAENRGHYGVLMGAIGLSLAAIAVGAVRLSRQPQNDTKGGHSERGKRPFVPVKDQEIDHTNRDNSQASVGLSEDPEPATHGGESRGAEIHHDVTSAVAADGPVVKTRGQRRSP